MLLEKKAQDGDIVAIKLVSGNEIIAKLVEESENVIVISKPVELGMAATGGVGFGPFMIGAPDEVQMTFDLNMVVTFVKARKEIKDAYIQSTSGIVPAGPGSVPDGLIQP